MDYLKIILIGIITFSIAYLTICTLSPEKVATSKTIIIHQPVKSVMAALTDLGTWNTWHPYLDSAVKNTVKQNDSSLVWSTHSNGEGKITIIATKDNNQIGVLSAFKKNGKWKTYHEEFLIEGNKRETKLSWVYVGESFPFFKRPANYVIKEVIGKTLERGLYRFNKYLRDDYPKVASDSEDDKS